VEARIQEMAPELQPPTRHRTYQPNPYFARGELPRVALAVLREAGERDAAGDSIVYELADKGGAKPAAADSLLGDGRFQAAAVKAAFSP
jgi:hypothetical protein